MKSTIEKAIKKAGDKDKSDKKFSPRSNYQDEIVDKYRNQSLSNQNEVTTKNITDMAEPKLFSPSELDERKIIFPAMQDSVVVNSFRKLRTNILKESKGKASIIMITSPTYESGNSFIAFNLASAFAFDESSTSLLIDCNLTVPYNRDEIKSSKLKGLSNYLESENLSIDSVIHPSGVKRLRIIPTGSQREDTTEYFTSNRMKQLFKDISSRYGDRYIFVDAPPVLELADTQILMELCDYILLVVPYGKIVESKVVSAVKSLDENKLLGIVFNNEPKIPKLLGS